MRRSRFTIYRPERDPIVVLGYTAEGVQHQFPGARIERGDYRRPVASRRMGFKIDLAAVAEAADVLGIKWPVDVVTNSRYGGSLGNHSLRYSGGSVRHMGGRIANIDTATRVHHRIMVKTYNSTKRAGEVIWHELCHAMQAEREAAAANATTPEDIHAAWQTCSARGVGIGYQRKPIEIEAREFEAWNDDHPLAKEIS